MANPTAEANRGLIAITDEDFLAVPDLLVAPDWLVFGGQNDLGQPLISFIKSADDGSAVLYLAAVRTGRRELTMQSIRRYPAAKDAPKAAMASIPSNVRNDGGDKFTLIELAQNTSAIDRTGFF